MTCATNSRTRLPAVVVISIEKRSPAPFWRRRF
jgi:hypothetical protein